MNIEEIKRRLGKLKALADRGVDGERANAEQMVSELMDKYGISPDFINEVAKERFTIRFGVTWERKLFVQLMRLCVGNNDDWGLYAHYKPRSRNWDNKTYEIECTQAQWIESLSKFEVLRRDYNRQLKNFYRAFLMRNDLLLPCDPNAPDPTEEEVEQEREVFELSQGIKKSELNPQLGYQE